MPFVMLGLAIAWGAALLARRGPTERFTYGLRSSSILAALFNAVFLLIAMGAVIWEALVRLVDGRVGERRRRSRGARARSEGPLQLVADLLRRGPVSAGARA